MKGLIVQVKGEKKCVVPRETAGVGGHLHGRNASWPSPLGKERDAVESLDMGFLHDALTLCCNDHHVVAPRFVQRQEVAN